MTRKIIAGLVITPLARRRSPVRKVLTLPQVHVLQANIGSTHQIVVKVILHMGVVLVRPNHHVPQHQIVIGILQVTTVTTSLLRQVHRVPPANTGTLRQAEALVTACPQLLPVVLPANTGAVRLASTPPLPTAHLVSTGTVQLVLAHLLLPMTALARISTKTQRKIFALPKRLALPGNIGIM